MFFRKKNKSNKKIGRVCACNNTGYFPVFEQSPCINCEKGENFKKMLNLETKKEKDKRLKKFNIYANEKQPKDFAWRDWE